MNAAAKNQKNPRSLNWTEVGLKGRHVTGRGPAHDDPGGLRVSAHPRHREEFRERVYLQQCGAGLSDRCPFVKKIGRCSAEDMETISVLLKGLLALE